MTLYIYRNQSLQQTTSSLAQEEDGGQHLLELELELLLELLLHELEEEDELDEEDEEEEEHEEDEEDEDEEEELGQHPHLSHPHLHFPGNLSHVQFLHLQHFFFLNFNGLGQG